MEEKFYERPDDEFGERLIEEPDVDKINLEAACKMADKEWRPQNPLKGVMVLELSFEHGKYLGWEAGASAMLKAVIKYLMGKCDNPEHTPSGYIQRVNATLSNAIPLRKDCPQCMEQLKESE